MAGSPLKRMRKAGVMDATGEAVIFPFLPPVTSANKPRGWNRQSAAEKVEHLLGMSLDRMHDYLAWPADGLDPYRLAAQTQVLRVILMIGDKVGIEAQRARDRQRIVAELARRFEARAEGVAADPQPRTGKIGAAGGRVAINAGRLGICGRFLEARDARSYLKGFIFIVLSAGFMTAICVSDLTLPA